MGQGDQSGQSDAISFVVAVYVECTFFHEIRSPATTFDDVWNDVMHISEVFAQTSRHIRLRVEGHSRLVLPDTGLTRRG